MKTIKVTMKKCRLYGKYLESLYTTKWIQFYNCCFYLDLVDLTV